MKSLIAEGKTKQIFGLPDGPIVTVLSKDDITAGDGAKHDIIEGKAAFANQTTCNVFRLLKACGIPMAFQKQLTPVSFEAVNCTMLPYEVVVRREAHGSYLKRAPHLAKGHIFPSLVLEFFLKTSGRKWKERLLICDDPLMANDWDGGNIHLYDPKEPNLVQSPAQPFLILTEDEVFTQGNERKHIEEMGDIAQQTFLILEKAWQLQGRKLVDFKVEFGIGPEEELLLADVIDNDSWRVVDGDGGYIDKQVYRDGGDLDTVTAKYRQVAELTAQFTLPSQRLVFWRGSKGDDLKPFYEAVIKALPEAHIEKQVYRDGGDLDTLLDMVDITCSAHKQPALAYQLLQQHVSEVPDTVVIAYIGRSNGAGPTLSANTTVPVITVPADWRNFPEDVWSSLRMPSNVPVMTVLEPENAVLAALQIFAMRNPYIYAALRFKQEKRLTEM